MDSSRWRDNIPIPSSLNARDDSTASSSASRKWRTTFPPSFSGELQMLCPPRAKTSNPNAPDGTGVQRMRAVPGRAESSSLQVRSNRVRPLFSEREQHNVESPHESGCRATIPKSSAASIQMPPDATAPSASGGLQYLGSRIGADSAGTTCQWRMTIESSLFNPLCASA